MAKCQIGQKPSLPGLQQMEVARCSRRPTGRGPWRWTSGKHQIRHFVPTKVTTKPTKTTKHTWPQWALKPKTLSPRQGQSPLHIAAASGASNSAETKFAMSSTLCRVFASTLVVGFSLLPGHAEYPPKPRFGGEVCDVWLVWRKNRMFLRHLKACGCWLWRVLTQRPRQAIDGFRETTWRAGHFLPTFALQDAHGRTQGPQDVWFCKILRSDQCSDDSSRAKRFKSRHSGLYSMHSSVEMLRCLQCAFPGCDALSLATCFGWRIAADIWAAWAVACAGCWKHFYGFDIESSRLVLENEFLHLELKPAQSYLEKRKTWFVWVLQDVLIPLI